MDLLKQATDYHRAEPKGKIGIALTKPCGTREELALAYTPGVGLVCTEIEQKPEMVWEYTNRGNMVAVVSDGTAVLGLGDIGPEAGLPVMEGKAALFKKFADIDALPLCLRLSGGVEEYVRVIRTLEPSLGGINLEDIAAPLCFEVEEQLDKEMGIPVFHDDQDGTAIVLIAGLMNALKVVGKELKNVKVVLSGAGAAGIACAKMMVTYGLDPAQIHMLDSQGLIHEGREDVNGYKRKFAQPATQNISLEEVIKGADVFIGVSKAGLVSQEMVRSMAEKAIIFAVANPVPEILPPEALAAGAAVAGSGRSDFANQVNNSLCFPGLFRAALDVRAWMINKEMKLAAAKAIAELVNEPLEAGFVKDILVKAYPSEVELFEREAPLAADNVIPKQFDLRVVPRVARAVAAAAFESGAAQLPAFDLEEYEKKVFERVKGNWGV